MTRRRHVVPARSALPLSAVALALLALLALAPVACDGPGSKIESAPRFPPRALPPTPPERSAPPPTPPPLLPTQDLSGSEPPEPPSAAPPAPPYTGPFAPALKNADLRSPMPGGFIGGWYGDTGLDIAGDHLEVFAIAAGTLDYSERGHTRWIYGRDTPYSVRLALDAPIAWGQHRITHVYYTHLSRLETEQAEGATSRKHVLAGERIAISGIGNGVPHLHMGLLLDDEVEQDSWTYILREDAIRKVMGGYANGALLPKVAQMRYGGSTRTSRLNGPLSPP